MTLENAMNINASKKLVSPKVLAEEIPLTEWQKKQVIESRIIIQNILNGNDDRMLLIVGPCSIHDVDAGIEYAKQLKQLANKVSNSIYIVMRCYFEKPRTTVGWSGLVTNPDITYKNDFTKGVRIVRKFISDIVDIGIPIATEFLDPMIPNYLSDFVSWVAIGARTTESQTHRQMASGLSMPVGFKNGTAGQYQLAIDAIGKAKCEGSFLGIDDDADLAELYTTGNDFTHIVLRGGKNPVTGEGIKNYENVEVEKVSKALEAAGERPNRIIIDCSHANSNKDHARQSEILIKHIVPNFKKGMIVGAMIESNLKEGSQAQIIPPYDRGPESFIGFDPKKDLEYGISITDACIGWEETEKVILELSKKIS
jgi:3-deoxy-7-phosphoheptulonate synthase